MPLRTGLFAGGLAVVIGAMLVVSRSGEVEPPRSASEVRSPGTEPGGAPRLAREESVEETVAALASGTPETSPPADPDEAYRKRAIGLWKQFETGVRWLEVRPDGTATMVVEPDWIAKAVIGDGLTVKIEWSIENGRALMHSVSGEPKSAFQAVTALYGSKRDRPIVTLDETKFVLFDEKDREESVWVRVGSGEAVPAALTNQVQVPKTP